jgi:hypothetical protein
VPPPRLAQFADRLVSRLRELGCHRLLKPSSLAWAAKKKTAPAVRAVFVATVVELSRFGSSWAVTRTRTLVAIKVSAVGRAGLSDYLEPQRGLNLTFTGCP